MYRGRKKDSLKFENPSSYKLYLHITRWQNKFLIALIYRIYYWRQGKKVIDCIVTCAYLSSPSKVWNRAVVSQCEVVAVIEKTIVSYSTCALYIVWLGSNSGVSWTEAGVIEILDSNGKSYWTTTALCY